MSFGPDSFLTVLKSIYEDLRAATQEEGYRFREEKLAMRLAAFQVFPCQVNVGTQDGKSVLWVKLGDNTNDWTINLDRDIPDIVNSPEKHRGGAQIASAIVYVILDEDEENEWSIQRMVWDYVIEVIRYNFAKKILIDWANREEAIFNEIGFRGWHINPFPESPTPCPQVIALAHPTAEGQIVSYSFQDVVEMVNRVKLLNCVPQNVFDVLNRTAKLCIWGYQDWEFFTMSQHYAVMTVETSFTTMYVHSLRRPVEIELVPRGGDRNNKRVSTVELREIATYGEFQSQEYWQERQTGIPHTAVRVNGEPIRGLRNRERSKSILHLCRQLDIISPGELLDIDYLLWKRNYFSHPHGVHIDMMGDALSLLHEVVTLINRTWMRFLHSERMMWENVWADAPSWVHQT